MRRILIAATAVAALFTLAGCSSPSGEGGAAAAGDSSGWADDISQLRDQATTELEQRILADGLISDEELAASEDAFVACAAAAGFTVTQFERGGGYSIDGPFTDDGPPALTQCEGSFNRTSGQYWMMQRNPSGEDEIDLMMACLVRAGVIEENFTRDDYMGGLGRAPLSIGSSEFGRCNSDPTTAFAE